MVSLRLRRRTTEYDRGRIRSGAHRATVYQSRGLPLQTWRASHIQCEGGANAGFCRSVQDFDPTADPAVPMGYLDRGGPPFYYGLASISRSSTGGSAPAWAHVPEQTVPIAGTEMASSTTFC